MTSRRYQKMINRQQELVLPMRVEDFVSENNSVRAIEAYVNTLELHSFGINHAEKAAFPPYAPQAMLKLSNTVIFKAQTTVFPISQGFFGFF